MLRQIFQGYRTKHAEVYLVGLVDSVKEVFTRAKIWRLLGESDHTSENLEDVLRTIEGNGGNLMEARARAEREGRNIDSELDRWDQLRTRA